MVPPPLLYAGALVMVLVLRWIWPLPISDRPAVIGIGMALVCLGVALDAWGAYSMIRAKTPIDPYRSATAVVTSGAFAWSHNPLYVGLHLVFLGLSFILNTGWGVLAFIPVVLVIHYGVIRREERYLEARFGEPYRRYCATVRRYG